MERRRRLLTEPSLYDRLGGYFGIAAVVNRFSDQIIRNPILNKNPALKAWNKTQAEARLPGLKFGRTLWIAAAAGGPFVYTGLPLSEAHAEFNLTAEQFAEVGAEIVRALDFYGVPEREQQELVAAYQSQHVRRRDGRVGHNYDLRRRNLPSAGRASQAPVYLARDARDDRIHPRGDPDDRHGSDGRATGRRWTPRSPLRCRRPTTTSG